MFGSEPTSTSTATGSTAGRSRVAEAPRKKSEPAAAATAWATTSSRAPPNEQKSDQKRALRPPGRRASRRPGRWHRGSSPGACRARGERRGERASARPHGSRLTHPHRPRSRRWPKSPTSPHDGPSYPPRHRTGRARGVIEAGATGERGAHPSRVLIGLGSDPSSRTHACREGAHSLWTRHPSGGTSEKTFLPATPLSGDGRVWFVSKKTFARPPRRVHRKRLRRSSRAGACPRPGSWIRSSKNL